MCLDHLLDMLNIIVGQIDDSGSGGLDILVNAQYVSVQANPRKAHLIIPAACRFQHL